MRLDRRSFLATALAGAGGAMLPRPARSAQARRSTDPFQLVPLGDTGIEVSLIGAGTGCTGTLAVKQTQLGPEKFDALIRHRL